MSDEDAAGDRLRVGGWLPTYDQVGRHAAPELPVPAPRDPPRAEPPVSPVPAGEPDDHRPPGGPGRRLILAGTVGLSLLVLLAVAVAIGRPDGAAPVASGDPSVTAATGDPQSPPPSSPAGPTSGAPTPSRVASPVRAPAPPPTAGTTPTAATPASPGPTDTPLTVGTRIGLAPVTNPGYRVRHRDFVGRIDPIGPGSVALDRADSTFTVRTGLADPRCVSFESVDYPGYFLRHQNFQIYLQQRDGTALFASDATFCPVTGLTGQHTSFRSVNYPGRYLDHRADQLYLDAPDGTDATRAAMTFAVAPGLYG